MSWIQARAEELPALDLGTFRVATFGQSFHRTDRERVAESVYDLLEPGGSIVLVAHTVEGRPKPPGPGLPEIPHEAIRTVIRRYLGSLSRSGQGFALPPLDKWEDALGRTRFGRPRHVFAPGRPDIVQDVDGVLANYLSMSFAAPHLFADRLEEFEADVRHELMERSPSGLFWDWPGDTEVAIATKPGIAEVSGSHRRRPGMIMGRDVPSGAKRANGQGRTVRSSERPASSRDHWAVGRPLVRVTAPSTGHGCGQPGGESSHVSWRPYTVRSMSA